MSENANIKQKGELKIQEDNLLPRYKVLNCSNGRNVLADLINQISLNSIQVYKEKKMAFGS